MQSQPNPKRSSMNGDKAEDEGSPRADYGELLKRKKIFSAIRERERQHFNSTGTMYADSTISNPSKSHLFNCLADAFRRLILVDEKLLTNDPKFEIFDERKHPLKAGFVEYLVPHLDMLEKYIQRIYQTGDMAPESLVMCLIYYKRIIALSNFRLTKFNWKRMVLSCLILASKVWEELAVWNKDFVNLFPLLTTKDLTKMEKIMLEVLQFDLTIKPSEYASVYFDLREISPVNFAELKPLDKEQEEKLEIRTKKFSHDSLAAHQKSLARKAYYSDEVKPKKQNA